MSNDLRTTAIAYLKPVIGYVATVWMIINRAYVIATELIVSSVKEKKFLLAIFYYLIIPLFIVLIVGLQPIVDSGDGIALYYAQRQTQYIINSYFLSFFLGQLLLSLLTADQIAGEKERGTYVLLITKPVDEIAIVIGKFIGMVGLTSALIVPTLFISYYYQLSKYQASSITYLYSLDEIVGVAIVVILLMSIIIALSLLMSTIFSKTLHAILSAFILLFLLSTAGSIFGTHNYASLQWYADVILPAIFFNLEVVKNMPSPISLFWTILGINVVVLTSTIIVLKHKETF